ncbi:MAG: DUF262 domain-containing protein [Lachnospiraceae bacterium]|jgi:hypothetical protein
MESKVFILDQTTVKKLLTIFKLVIPDFQRNFVWKKNKKEQLLASLFRGFPIGAITLYQDKNAYYIIDGLQRINTLNQYLARPGTIISFETFFKKVEPEIHEYMEKKKLDLELPSLKKCIRTWYDNLNNLYEFEKVSVFYSALNKASAKIARKFSDLELVEGLLDILKSKIEIVHDDIALIIYKGSKEDLPELFKNINTGSVALSQYEILQSVWNDYILDSSLIQDTREAFGRELDLIQNEYEINAIKEAGSFDIFKNIVGLNHIICCEKECDVLFQFSSFKKISEPEPFANGIVKYYDNDSIAFEIYSTLLCNAPNQIVKAIDQVYKQEDCAKISRFINQVNQVILEALHQAVKELKNRKVGLLESKYHSLYILAGMIFSRYDINVENLTVTQTEENTKIYKISLDIEQHKRDKWFVGEKRQVGFLNIQLENLLGMKSDSSHNKNNPDSQSAGLKIKIEDQIITANTVKEFYGKIFRYLEEQFDLKEYVPYATGKKRYLINHTKHHINGDMFLAPIKVGDYFIETHKSRSGALRDVYNYMKHIGVDAEYIE